MSRVLPRATGLVVVACFACLPRVPVHSKAIEYNARCVEFVRSGSLREASIACNHALEFSPDYAEAWNNKGLVELRGGNVEVARRHFIRALHLNPDLASAYVSYGALELLERRPVVAKELFERALKVDPDFLEARYNLALAWSEMGKPDEARRELRTMVLVNPALADAHRELGVLAMADNDLKEAIHELEKATELDPNRPSVWGDLGAAYLEAGRYDDASRAYKSCLSGDPESGRCAEGLIRAQLQNPYTLELTSLYEHLADASRRKRRR